MTKINKIKPFNPNAHARGIPTLLKNLKKSIGSDIFGRVINVHFKETESGCVCFYGEIIPLPFPRWVGWMGRIEKRMFWVRKL